MTTLRATVEFIQHSIKLLNEGLKSNDLTDIGKHRYEGRLIALKEVYGVVTGKIWEASDANDI